MKFCLITTFFGKYSFGGDAIAVEHLASALLDYGHEVHVIYPTAAYNLLNRQNQKRLYKKPDDLFIQEIESPIATLSPLYIHQTGRMGDLRSSVKQLLDSEQFDVIHVHNISLAGGLGLLDLIATYDSVTLMTTHEYWLLCPLSSLWQFNKQVCEHPQCVTCSIKAGKPPQLWRSEKRIQRSVSQLDAIISPSKYTLDKHIEHNITAKEMRHIPLFLPISWAADVVSRAENPYPRSYFLAVGRLVKEKGFQTLLPVMAKFPDVDLLIAGDGNYRDVLEQNATGSDNIHFLGHLSHHKLRQYYQNAVALLAPSIVLETFGFVIIEAMSQRTPVIARNRSAYRELIIDSGAGLNYDNNEELVQAMRTLLKNPDLRDQLGNNGQQAVKKLWSKEVHMQAYLSLIDDIKHS